MSIVLVGSTSGSITLQEPAVAGTTVLDLPATSGNVVVDSATQTLTNKSIAATQLTGTIAAARLPTGSVLQVVSTTKVDAFITTSTSPVDVTGLTLNITPTSTTSKILVLAQIYGGSDNATALYVNIVRNSTALSVGTSGTGFNSTMGSFFAASTVYATCPIVFLDSPATTSSTTYKIQIFTSGGTAAVNRRANDLVVGGSSTITVMEIAA